MPHVALKHLCAGAKATIRTADTTLHGNAIIMSG